MDFTMDFRSFLSSSLRRASSALRGSSSSRILDPDAMALARATLCCCPPDKCVGLSLDLDSRCTMCRRLAAIFLESSGSHSLIMGPNMMLSITDMWGNSEYCWDSMVAPRLAVSSSVTSSPSKDIVPLSGRVRPQIIRMAVVLPAPVGPSMHRYSPSSTSRFRRSAATASPKRLQTSVIRMTGISPYLPCG